MYSFRTSVQYVSTHSPGLLLIISEINKFALLKDKHCLEMQNLVGSR